LKAPAQELPSSPVHDRREGRPETQE
jgi:hypothetical protein